MSKILLADDDISTRQFLTGALEKAGHDVTACEDGASALEAFKMTPQAYDMLLTDVVMPEMDGIELAGRAKALRPDLKIMFITGFAAMSADAGADKVISKPFHLGDLIREIDAMLRP